MMLTQDQVREIIGTEAYARDGEKIGKVAQVYVDDTTLEPSFATVHTGFLGMKENFVPLEQATFDGECLTVPYEKELVKEAPATDPAGRITPEEVEQLYLHYGLDYAGPATPEERATAHGRTAPETTGSGHRDDAMTRSEEQLQVGTREEETGRVRLRKYVVTEDVTTTVPVREERAVIEREPITDANRGDALAGPELTESEHEVTLHKEVPVVGKETTPVERVRVRTDETRGEETVTEQVRKEQIEVEGDLDDTGR